MHVVVVSTSHRGDDARIIHRQARSLLQAGHPVTAVLPDPGDLARASDPTGLERVVVRRAVGRRRVRAWVEARRAVRSIQADVVIVHDLELVPWIRGRGHTRLVWDMHEDFVALVDDTVWIPRPFRFLIRAAVRGEEGVARRKCLVILAEDAYRSRFPEAPVVPNTTWVDDELTPCVEFERVVYVGRLSWDRGLAEMIDIGRRIRDESGLQLVLVGAADADCRAELVEAARRGDVDWRGPLPNPEALTLVRGSLAGLSLLHDVANYVVSRPTKIFEYMAAGVPAISTPLPLARQMLDESKSGVLTSSWRGNSLVDEVVAAVEAYASDSARRAEEGRQGWEYAHAERNWNRDGRDFVRIIEQTGSSRG
jgi:glycosyltransferase involved in cell wall biosynthesis